MMTRSVLAERAGVHAETIRYYERQGLLEEPPRTSAGYRVYTDEAVARLKFVTRAKELGFTLDEVRELIELRLDPLARAGDVRARAVDKLSEVEARIRDLQAMRDVLRDLVERCDGRSTTDHCPIVRALDMGHVETDHQQFS